MFFAVFFFYNSPHSHFFVCCSYIRTVVRALQTVEMMEVEVAKVMMARVANGGRTCQGVTAEARGKATISGDVLRLPILSGDGLYTTGD